MPFCPSCGRDNEDVARFCISCGRSMIASAPLSPPTMTRGTSALRTTTLILGLISAVFLLIGGCAGYVAGATFGAFEEAFEVDTDDPDQVSSTTEDVVTAGAGAMVVALWLFVGVGLAKVSIRISLVLLVLAMPMLLGLVFTDWSSLFAITYYFAILTTGICIVLMSLAYLRERRSANLSH